MNSSIKTFGIGLINYQKSVTGCTAILYTVVSFLSVNFASFIKSAVILLAHLLLFCVLQRLKTPPVQVEEEEVLLHPKQTVAVEMDRFPWEAVG